MSNGEKVSPYVKMSKSIKKGGMHNKFYVYLSLKKIKLKELNGELKDSFLKQNFIYCYNFKF